MLQFMQSNVLLYAMTAVGVLGAVSQVILRIVYDKLIRDMEKPMFAKGKYMRHLKQKYNLYRKTQSGIDSINIFIQKSMMEYRFLGMNLHTWRRMGGAAFIICAAAGAAGWYLSGTVQMAETMRQNYLWAVLASAFLVAGAYGITDTGYRRKYLETGLRSLFTNSSTQLAETVGAPENAESSGKSRIQAVKASPEKRKQGKIIETQAQRDKRELKANLAKIKEGFAETAAADRNREHNIEILKQMDSSEQERVIREVLKEFL